MTIEALNLAIMLGAALVVSSVLSSVIAFRFGAPLLLIFLLLGLAFGEDGLGIPFDDTSFAYAVGSVAIAIILFDSGFTTRWRSLALAAGPAGMLATVGVLITAGTIALFGAMLLDLDWLSALLLGAIVSSTDAAAVFFLLRVGGITLRDRVRSTLEVESGSNDPMAIFLTLSLASMATLGEIEGHGGLWQMLVVEFMRQMGFGLIGGLAGGWLLVQGLNRIRLDPGLYPIVALAAAVLLATVVNALGGSGFLAIYIAGVIAGNSRVHAAGSLGRFQEGMTWLAQITMFLTLGLLATPSQFISLAPAGLALALLLIFVARPLAVWLCLLPFGFSRKETLFIGWVGLRGAVSILLALVPVLSGLESGRLLFNLAFIVVFVSLVVQGWTLRPVARRLGLVVPPAIGPLDRSELELPGAPGDYELLTYRVADDCPVAQGERIPRWARPSLIVREGKSLLPERAGRPQAGDYVYIFAAHSRVALMDRLFAARAEGDLEQEAAFYGDFALEPDAPLTPVALLYGLEVPADVGDATVAGYLSKAVHGRPETGDRVRLGAVELIVRAVDEEGHIADVGLAVDPAPERRVVIPYTRRALAQVTTDLKARLARRRRGKAAAAAAGGVHDLPEAPDIGSGDADPDTRNKKGPDDD